MSVHLVIVAVVILAVAVGTIVAARWDHEREHDAHQTPHPAQQPDNTGAHDILEA